MATTGIKQKDSLKDDAKSILLASPSMVYLYYQESGRLKDFVDSYKKSPDFHGENAKGDDISYPVLLEAEWQYYLGNVKKSKSLAKQVLRSARMAEQTEIELSTLLLLARIDLFTGDFTELHRSMNAMDQLERRDEEQTALNKLSVPVDICKTFIYASLQQTDKIAGWLLEYDYAKRLQYNCIAFANMSYGKALMVLGENLKLLETADDFYIQAIMSPNLLAVIYTEIYRAIACYRIGQPEVSIEAMVSAFDIAEADHIVMPFVENGKDILPILELMGDMRRYQTFIQKITNLYQDTNKSLKIIVNAQSIK